MFEVFGIVYWILVAVLIAAFFIFVKGVRQMERERKRRDSRISTLEIALFRAIRNSDRCQYCIEDDQLGLWHCHFGGTEGTPLCGYSLGECPMLRPRRG